MLKRKNNLVIAFVTITVKMAVSFAVYPVFVKILSPFELSVYLLFIGTASIFDLLDFNFSNSLIRYFAYAEAGATKLHKEGINFALDKSDRNESELLFFKLLSMAKMYYKIMCLFEFLVVGLGFGIYLYFFAKQHNEDAMYYIFNWLLYSGATVTGVYFMYLAPSIISKGHIDQVNKITFVSKLLGAFFQILFAYFYGLIGLSMGTVIYVIAERFMLYSVYQKKVTLNVLEKVSRDEFLGLIKVIWHNNYKLGCIAVSNIAISRMSFFVAGLVIKDVNLLSSFLFTCQVFAILIGVAHVPISNNYSDISVFILKYREKAIAVFLRNNRLSIWISIFCGLVITIFGNFLGGLVNIRKIFLSGDYLCLLSIIMILEKQLVNHSTMISIYNKVPMVKSYLLSSSAICMILICEGFFFNVGVLGLILPQLFVQACYNYWYWVKFDNEHLGITTKQYLYSLVGIK